MADRSETTGRRNAVRLIKDPTNLAGTAPKYGGTELGAARAYRLMPVDPVALVKAEEKGGRVVEGIRGGRYAVLSVILRGFDADAIKLMFADSTSGGGVAVVDPGTVGYPGALASAAVCKILCVPEVTGEHAIYFPRAMAILARELEIPFENRNEVAIAATFVALPDASSRVYYVDTIGNLTL